MQSDSQTTQLLQSVIYVHELAYAVFLQLAPAPAPAPRESTQIFTLNLGGAQIAAPLTPSQTAALEGTLNRTVGSIPGVSSVSVAGVQVGEKQLVLLPAWQQGLWSAVQGAVLLSLLLWIYGQ